jgi:hypothetical protein
LDYCNSTRQRGCNTIGNRSNGETEENARGTPDATESAVRDGPVGWWGGDYGGEGVGDGGGAGADENTVRGDCPEDLDVRCC